MPRVICPNCSNAYTPAIGRAGCTRCGYVGEPVQAPRAAYGPAGGSTFTPVQSAPATGFAPPGPVLQPIVAPTTNGLAVASMVLGIVSVPFFIFGTVLGLLAIILGLVGFHQIKKNGQRGSGMAITGIVLGSLVLAGWAVFYFWIMTLF